MELKHKNDSSNEELRRIINNNLITALQNGFLSTILDWMGSYFVAFKGDEEN